MNMAATLELDAVIDPANTRQWLLSHLPRGYTEAVVRPYVDAW